MNNRIDQIRALSLLNRFQTIPVDDQDILWAEQALIRLRLSHGILGFDAMIAAVNYRLQIPLYTRNLKHFVLLIGNLAQAPY